jgi:hypothetical protein
MVAGEITPTKKNAVCNACTLRLINLAYRRKPVFRLFREPLKWGMRVFSWIYRVNPDEYAVRTPSCYGCIRFYKVALKEKSPLFRWLNDRINPLFDRELEKIVREEELARAQEFARRATAGKVSAVEAEEWMENQKMGF